MFLNRKYFFQREVFAVLRLCSPCAAIFRQHLNAARFYLPPLNIEVKDFFWGGELRGGGLAQLASTLRKLIGVSACIPQTSKQAIPCEHTHTHTPGAYSGHACTHTDSHRRVHRAGTKEWGASCFLAAFPYMLITILLLSGSIW